MKAEELTELDAEELASRLRDSRRELYELRFKLAVGQLDDHRQIRKVRHDIARILTSIRQRDLGLARRRRAGGRARGGRARQGEGAVPPQGCGGRGRARAGA